MKNKTPNTMKNNTKFKIETNIPIPPKSVGVINYPFACMKKGDSFLVEVEKGKNPKKVAKNLGSCAFRFCKSHAMAMDWKFTYRQEGRNVRIWREK